MRKDSLTVDSGNSCEGNILKTPLVFSLGIGNVGGGYRIFWTLHGLCLIIRIPAVSGCGGVFVVVVVVCTSYFVIRLTVDLTNLVYGLDVSSSSKNLYG